MRKINIFLVLFLFIYLSSCIDKYLPSVNKYENLLVVDGLLTNGIDPLEISLSLSSAVSNPKLIPVSNAEVFISDENNIITMLYEKEAGIYKPIDSAFYGQSGNSYQLNIKLANGKSYVSDICKMPQTSQIDSVYGVAFSSSEDFGSPGIQFYVENNFNLTDTLYYRWKLSQTYEYRSTFDIDYTWEGELIPNPNATDLRTCWRTSRVTDFIISSTKLLQTASKKTFPLNFVSTETKMLSIKYSLLVKQLSITEEAFNFYHSINEQNKQLDNLWSQQPYQITGNIHNVNNPDELVLGYFVVAGESEKRIFITRPNIQFSYPECKPDFEGMRFIAFEPKEMWPIYIDDIMFFGLARAHSKACFDCRLDGGTLTPPPFWK